MGKASRTKRERREHVLIEPPTTRRQFPVFWSMVMLIIVGGVAALVLTAPDQDEKKRVKAVANAPTWAEVDVQGAELPKWTGGKDSAVGTTVPSISGTTIEGLKTTLGSDDAVARAYVVVAHWCPHCNAEVPRIVDWAKDTKLPAGVEVVALSTAADETQPNFPPATWLAEEAWSFDAVVDDEVGTAAEALGVEGFPFMVFVDRQGVVQERFSGEMPIKDFDAAITRLGKG